MSLFEELKVYGVNIDEGLSRLGGNENLYKRLLGSFTSNMEEYYITSDFDSENYSDIITKAHTIKGIAGNLSITPLYDSYSRIVSFLRSSQVEEAREEIDSILPVQEAIIACIKKYM